MTEHPIIVRNWDSMLPIVHADGEIYSTRVLAEQHRIMRDALLSVRDDGNDAYCCHIIAGAAIPEAHQSPEKPAEIRGIWTSHNASTKL